VLTSVDKRTKYYKAYKDTIVEFEALNEAILKKYVKKEISLSDKNCSILIEICEHDYGRILLEIDKIKRYADIRYTEYNGSIGNDFDSAFQDLVQDGTIYEPPYDAIFDLVDAILDRKVNKTFNLLQQSYAVGEATMVMLSVLYTNAKAVLQVQTYEGNNLSKAIGLTGFQIKNAKAHVNKYSEEELIYIVQLVQKIESGIKTGRMEDEFAMQYLLTHIM
jgi:DNA polymerase III delta subunit